MFLPVCGEPIQVLHNTWTHVRALVDRYPGDCRVLRAVPTARQDLPGEPDYAAAGRIVTAGQRPGDGIVYDGDFGARRAMAYELREGARPKDVLMKLTPQQSGRYTAVECDVPAACMAGGRRLWLVSAAAGTTRSGMRAGTAAVLAGRFTVVHTERLHNLTVQLLERRNR
ncbi:hypothetical protein ACPCVO_51180 [Streptomyces umbrinus]|uniref:hypothetical protein n=1 Tax=Streptomyces umbrinus TaxID=67370 RepID=UPI003C30AAC9